MNIKVGDVVYIDSGQYYKVIEITPKGVPSKIIEVLDKYGLHPKYTGSSQVFSDTWNDWHTYNWKVVYNISYNLTEADKKYEKIIIKIKQLDSKFKERKAA